MCLWQQLDGSWDPKFWAERLKGLRISNFSFRLLSVTRKANPNISITPVLDRSRFRCGEVRRGEENLKFFLLSCA